MTELSPSSLKKNLEWVRLIVRRGEKGLSTAVIRGLEEAESEYCIVMDADGSHPASAIPNMISSLIEGADFTVGSRYVQGGTTEDGWGVLRWLNSKIATLMARPFTTVNDSMSGFLGMKRETFLAAKDLNPVGYKIGLELIVKCGCKNVVEVPIHFRTRQLGESKLTLRVQWEYFATCYSLTSIHTPKFCELFYICSCRSKWVGSLHSCSYVNSADYCNMDCYDVEFFLGSKICILVR